MDIKEIRKRKKILEKNLSSLIAEFEKDCDVTVSNICCYSRLVDNSEMLTTKNNFCREVNISIDV